MTKKLLTLVFLILTFSSYSQEAINSFSMQEAIDFALENNLRAKNASKDIDAALQLKKETTATGLPQINADIGYQNFLKQQVSLLPAEFFGGNPGEFAEVVFGTKQSVNATATLSQKLFDGSYLVALQSAKVFLEISKNAKEKTDLELRKAVINAYGNVLLAEESTKILDRNLTVLKKNLFEITKIYENGLEEEESVEQLQITLSGIESNLNNTKRLKTLAYQMLNMTLGLEIDSNTTLTDTLKTLTTQYITLQNLDSTIVFEDIIDFRIAANDTRSKELLLKLEKSKSLPTLNAFINGGYSTFGDTFVFADSDTKWFGSSLLGVNLRVPVFSSGMRNASTQRAKINLEKSKNNLTETQQRLKLEIASAKSNYKFAVEDYENKKKNLNLAERIEQKNQIKFFEGISSSFALRQAQTQLYASQQEFLQAMLDVINKKAALETVLNITNN